ncbi:MAG TPA: hypothetical protein VFK19_13390 [Sphingomicrobium sp.]|nr:hypothetical protein [Sphingomicrobium sp.]
MSDRFVIEADKSVVGVAVRSSDGFRFFTSNPDFKRLEGKTFRRARALVRRVQELAAIRRRALKSPRRSVQ